MTDIIDQANTIAEETLSRALANAPKFNRPSLAECDDCGETIPPQRCQLGGVTRCVDCQTYHDEKQRTVYGKK